MGKIRKAGADFSKVLALVTVLSFAVIALDSFTSIDISPWFNGLVLVIVGGGLLVIGQVFSMLEYIKDGILTQTEVAHILTAVVGLFSVVIGIATLPIEAARFIYFPALEGIRGMIAIFAIVIILVEAFLVN